MESPKERRRRLNRARQQRWRSRQRQETLEIIRQEDAERHAQRRSQESTEDKQARRATIRLLNRVRQQRWRSRQRQETLEIIRQEDAERHAQRRSQESTEEKQARRAAIRLLNRVRQQRWRSRQRQETLEIIREEDAERHAQRRSQESTEDKQARRAAIRLSQLRRIARETPEQANKRKAAHALSQAKHRARARALRQAVSQTSLNEEFHEDQFVHHDLNLKFEEVYIPEKPLEEVPNNYEDNNLQDPIQESANLVCGANTQPNNELTNKNTETIFIKQECVEIVKEELEDTNNHNKEVCEVEKELKDADSCNIKIEYGLKEELEDTNS